MTELRASTTDSTRLFSLDGLDYPKGVYTIFYRGQRTTSSDDNEIDTSNVRVGIRSREDYGEVLQSPILFNQYTTDGTTPYASLDALVQEMADLLGFNRASGGGGSNPSRMSFVPSASPFVDIAARDTWSAVNLSDLHNDSMQVTLIMIGQDSYEWAGDDTPSSYSSASWILRSSGLTLGQEETLSSLASIPEGRIPYRTVNGFEDSSVRRLPSGEVLAPASFTGEALGLNLGRSVTVSDISGFLGVRNNIRDEQYIVVDTLISPDSASPRPSVFRLTEAENDLIVQGVGTEQLTGTSLTITYVTTLDAQTNSLEFQGFAASTNVRVRITDVDSGIVSKYIPSEAAWLDGLGGVDFLTGSGVIDLVNSPLRFTTGSNLRIDIEGESLNLMGNISSQPMITARIQRGVFEDMAYLSDVTTNNNDPSVHNLSIDIPSRVDLNTDLNVDHQITYSITNRNMVSSLELLVTGGDNKSISIPTSDGQHTVTVGLTGIDSSTEGSVSFQLQATEAGGVTHDSNTVSVQIRTLPVHELSHFGTIPQASAASSIDFTSDLSTTEEVAGSYTISGIPTDASLHKVYFAVPTANTNLSQILQSAFNITSQFTQTTETIAGETYNVWLMNSGSAVNSNYNNVILNVT